MSKISSVYFKGQRDRRNYVVMLDDDSIFNFAPYSSLDGIAASAIEDAIRNLISENKGNIEIKKEDFNSPSTMHREEVFIPDKKEYQFKVKTTLTTNDSYSFSNEISLRNKKKEIGVDYNVLLGQHGAEDRYFVQELKKVFGEHGNISANINTWAFCRNDRAISDEEKIMLKQHFDDNISQILSASAEEISRKPA